MHITDLIQDVKKRGLGMCFNCRRVVDSSYYCLGCHAYICDQCEIPDAASVGASVFAPHNPGDHLIRYTETDSGTLDPAMPPLSDILSAPCPVTLEEVQALKRRLGLGGTASAPISAPASDLKPGEAGADGLDSDGNCGWTRTPIRGTTGATDGLKPLARGRWPQEVLDRDPRLAVVWANRGTRKT